MNYARIGEAKASMERFLYDMAEVVHPDRIVLTGDLIHAKNQSSPEATDLAGWFLEECSKIAVVILTLGNHDGLVENTDRMDSITPIINRLKNPNIKFYKDTGIYEDDNICWVVYSAFDKLIPQINNGNFVIPYDTGNVVIPIKPDKKYYGLFHGVIQGAKLDTGYVFTESGVPTKIFNDLDAVFCGDIHNRFVMKNNIGSPIIMVGSFTQQNYRENLVEHGYCIFNVADASYSFVDIEGNTKYMTFQVSDIKDIQEGTEKLLNKT
jgi:DNA repair exonuclease SbcCD nuclease subunit